MNKLPMQTPNLADENFAKLQALFPNAVTEVISGYDEAGKPVVTRAIDKDVLMQEISVEVVDGPRERYQFTWPDKKKSVLLANAPIQKTLRPCREESVDFDHTENLYIEGDNLDVLKLLRETYLGKIKMIYIDPPYNTGNDFVYEDDFAESMADYAAHSGDYDDEGNRLVKNLDSNGRFHTDWLNMIYPRLKLARDLLTDDGVIFISIDEHESHNLRKICDEVFGVQNFITQICWEKRYTRSNNAKRFTTLTEPLLCYAKCLIDINEIKEKRSEKADSIYSNPDNDPRGVWTSVSYVNPATKDQRPNLVYPIINPFTQETVLHPTNAWKYEKSTYEEHVKGNKLYWGRNGENTYPRLKKFLSELDGGMVPVDLWRQDKTGTTDQASKELEQLLGRKIFDFPKPKELIERIVSLIINGKSDNDFTVLDFFSGSATTAHAVMQLNAEDGGKRKFIMVQLPEETEETSEAFKAGYKNICEIGKERIRRAGAKIKEGLRHDAHTRLGEHKADDDQMILWSHGETKINGVTREDLTYSNENGEMKKRETHSPQAEKDRYYYNSDLLDTGFRVLKLDSTNMKPVYYTPDAYTPSLFDSLIDNIKDDRTAEDLLFQVMLDRGVLPSSKIEEKTIGGKRVFFVAGNYLVACFDADLDEATITAIAKTEPYYFVTRESSLATDSAKTNLEQLFKTYSPTTEWWVM